MVRKRVFRYCDVGLNFAFVFCFPTYLSAAELLWPLSSVGGVCCAEMTAGVTFERRRVLDVENQLLAAAPCTFFALRFPMNLALLMPSALKAGPHTLPVQRYKINVFLHFQ